MKQCTECGETKPLSDRIEAIANDEDAQYRMPANGAERYDVRLEYPNCKTVSVDGDDGIISDVNAAICIANGFAS